MNAPKVVAIDEAITAGDSITWYVKRENGRGPRVAHSTYAEANKEAQRLANKHPGQKFYILQATHVVVQPNVREITIRMPKESLKKWLGALKSGEYKQAQHVLRVTHAFTGEVMGYCCLGVLEHALVGDKMELGTLPSHEWLAEHNIEFRNAEGDSQEAGFVVSRKISCPFLPSLGTDAWRANDIHHKNFAEIADAIEKCAEGF
jgi:hypothetical protein